MNSSTMKFLDRAKRTVTYKSNKFKCSDTIPDTYNCIHSNCGAYIVLDKDKNKITSSNLEHMNHHPSIKLRPRTTTDQPKSSLSSLNVNSKNSNNKKRVSFTVNVVNSPQNKNTTKSCELTNKSDKKNEVHDVPTRDASQSTPTLPVASIERSSSNNTSIRIPTVLCDNAGISNLAHTTLAAKVRVPSVGTQTDGEENHVSCVQMREDLMNEIRVREHEILNLKQHLASLELIITTGAVHDHPAEPRQTNQTVQTKNSPFKCHIIGDSHVRGLRDKLLPLLPTGCSVETCFQPGAGFQLVAAAHTQAGPLIQLTTDDVVVLLCGTNDLCTTQWETIQNSLDGLLEKFQHCRLLCISNIPFRFDNKKLNFHISRLNAKIRFYVKSKSKNVHIIDSCKNLKPKDYSKDGVHINKGGKSKLCARISKIISSCSKLGCSSPPPQFPSEQLDSNISLGNLIDLDAVNIHLPSQTIGILNMDSTFSPENYSKLFPEITPRRAFHSTKYKGHQVESPISLLDTPNVPVKINELLENKQTDYYKITHLCNSTIQGNTSYLNNLNSSHNIDTPFMSQGSPITCIEPGYYRQNNFSNFKDGGPTSKT